MTLNGCRLGFYEPLRKTITTALYDNPSRQSLGINIFSGAASGILGAAAGSPFFLVKTRLQSYSPFLPVGTQHQYKNALDGARKIYGQEGVTGLYRGVGAAMVRTGFGSAVQLPTYFFAKRRLVRHLGMDEGMPLHLASSTASGVVVCCVMHPPGTKSPRSSPLPMHGSLVVDTVMSRMYNQTGNLYKGVFDCIYKTISTEGVLAIYKGFFAHLARILPHTVQTLPRLHLNCKFDPAGKLTIRPGSYAHLGRANQQAHAPGRRPNTTESRQGPSVTMGWGVPSGSPLNHYFFNRLLKCTE